MLSLLTAIDLPFNSFSILYHGAVRSTQSAGVGHEYVCLRKDLIQMDIIIGLQMQIH